MRKWGAETELYNAESQCEQTSNLDQRQDQNDEVARELHEEIMEAKKKANIE